jgi:RluA family pseudouridine synthase
VGHKPLRILTRPMRAGAEITVERRPEAEGAGEPARPSAAGLTTRARQGAEKARAGQGAPQRHLELRVLLLDRYLLVVDKPAGLLSEHDRFGSPSVESLAPRLLAAKGERPERSQLWLVHRLDAGTSGVLVLARTPMAAQVLGEAFREGKAKKTYLALVQGRLEGEHGVDAPIGRAERTRHAVSPTGKPARTHVTALSGNDVATLVRASPETGRTHQIRVHLTHLGHPLWGDGLYGGPTYTPGARAVPVPRPLLHARRLVVAHPKTGQILTLEAPVPSDFTQLAAILGLTFPEST